MAKWIRPKDVILDYGIKRTYLYKLINNDEIKSKKKDGIRLISVESIEKWLDSS